jgi:hypothetical protein
MARRKRYDELNLTPRRALDLLVLADKALGGIAGENHRRALDTCRDALEKHVRFGLRRRRR